MKGTTPQSLQAYGMAEAGATRFKKEVVAARKDDPEWYNDDANFLEGVKAVQRAKRLALAMMREADDYEGLGAAIDAQMATAMEALRLRGPDFAKPLAAADAAAAAVIDTTERVAVRS